MNEQDINYARNEIRRALVEVSDGTKGQLEAFNERLSADIKARTRRRSHLVELESPEGARYVSSHVSSLSVRETRSRHQPMPLIKNSAFHSAPWRRAVNSLDQYQQAWVRYCYGFDLDFKHQTLMCEYVWNRYQKYLVGNPLQSRVVKKLVGLVWLAAQEIAATRKNDSYKEYAGAALARMLSVDRSTWKRVYAGHWEKLKAAFVELDNLALYTAFIRYAGNDKIKNVM